MSKEKITKKLSNIGLSDKEASVYSALLELGGAYPSKIAEITKINRSTVYKVLLSLSIKGLVNEIEKKNKIFYQIEDPNKLIRFSKEQLRISESNLNKAQDLVPELRELFSSLSNKPKVLFFEGHSTIQNLCDDMVNVEKSYEMLAFSNAELFKGSLSIENRENFVKEKEQKGIKTRAMVPDTSQNRSYNETVFKNIKNKEIWPKIRYVDAEKFMFNGEITIYGIKKVSIAKFDKDNLIGVLIEDQTIHDMMKMIFEIAWESAKE